MNYYQTLNIPVAASPEEVREAFLQELDKIKNKKATKSKLTIEQLISIYKELINPETRSAYDLKELYPENANDPDFTLPWREHYRNYTAEKIWAEIEFADKQLEEPTTAPGLPKSWLLFLIVLILGTAGMTAYIYLKFNQSKSSAVESTKAKPIQVIYDLSDLFPTEAGLIKKLGNPPCSSENYAKIPSSILLAFYAARYNCDNVAVKDSFKISDPSGKILTDEEYAKSFASDRYLAMQQANRSGLRNLPNNSTDSNLTSEIDKVKQEISSLRSSIFFDKAQNSCQSFAQVGSDREMLNKYQSMLACMQKIINSERDQRNKLGHVQIPK